MSTLVVVVLAMLLPSAALAAAPSAMLDQYGNPGIVDPATSDLDPTAALPGDAAATDVAAADAEGQGAGAAGAAAEPVAAVELDASVNGVGALPLTGAELGLLVVGGALLLGSGFVLRRMGAREDELEPVRVDA